jgi:type IV secretory pathway VirB2 component (pilin)
VRAAKVGLGLVLVALGVATAIWGLDVMFGEPKFDWPRGALVVTGFLWVLIGALLAGAGAALITGPTLPWQRGRAGKSI